MIGPLYVGNMYARHGPQIAFIGEAGIMALILVVSAILYRRMLPFYVQDQKVDVPIEMRDVNLIGDPSDPADNYETARAEQSS